MVKVQKFQRMKMSQKVKIKTQVHKIWVESQTQVQDFNLPVKIRPNPQILGEGKLARVTKVVGVDPLEKPTFHLVQASWQKIGSLPMKVAPNFPTYGVSVKMRMSGVSILKF